MSPWLTVMGMGDDGPDGLAPAARAVVERARVVVGGRRHLDRLGPGEHERIPWPQPFSALGETLERLRGRAVCVLATGDPTCYGVGSVLVERFGLEAVRIVPAPSAFSLACARLGWAAQGVQTLSLHGRPPALLHPFVQPGVRLLALSANAGTPGEVARMLLARGYGGSRLTVLSHLGGEKERVYTATAGAYAAHHAHDAHEAVADLNTIAIECVADPGAPLMPRTPGLADEHFEHDGQLTKREVRAITLAALSPVPGQLLWDIGAGCGSIGIEWMRRHPACRAVAIEPDAGRVAMIAANSAVLGTPGLEVVNGRAVAALEGLEAPDAVFVGGGITEPDLLDRCWSALGLGGRLVANVVSVEGEAVLDRWHRIHGGRLTRIAITRCEPLGRYRGWRPLMPVTQLAVTKGSGGG
ncbi:MAG: precorrin-6y C5,15-methyltransferase (decarboxylating) subunit CbiE [Thiotrichales bacterium]|nr:precorrin-6y C5,15-methyltransferase (decarboxylating) subunit CbiE [Thiotrichales bacterium]